MSVRIAELVGVITADNSNFQRKMAESEKTAQNTAKSIERSFKGDPFRDFDKNLAKIDRMLAEIERPRQLQFSTNKSRNEIGQFVEALAQGDPAELLGEIAQSGGPAGLAIAGVGLAAAGATLAVVGFTSAMAAMTASVIESVRETDLLAKNTKLSTEQIQGLQVIANLTGESVEDLAENYKKISPEVQRFEQMVRNSGNAIDAELRERVQDAAIAWEQFKSTAEGALYEIARGALPQVSASLIVLNDQLLLMRTEWGTVGTIAGKVLAGIAAGAIAAGNQIQYMVGGLAALSRLDLKGVVENSTKFGSGTQFSIDTAKAYADIQSLASGQSNSGLPTFPKVPRLAGGGRSAGQRGGGASDADAARRAQMDLEKVQAAELLKIEQQQINQSLDLAKRAHEEKLRFIGDNLNAEIDEFNRYYAERANLQERSIDLEIENEAELWRRLDAEQKKAKKQSEKLRLEADKERAAGRLDLLRLERSAIGGNEDATRQAQTRKAQEDQRKVARELADAYKSLQSDLIDLNGSEYDKFLQNLQRTTKELQTLATVTNDQRAFDLLRQYTAAANQQFQLGQLGRDRQGLKQGLGLQIERINRREDAGLLTEGKAYEQRLQVQRAMKDLIVENLQQEQLILEALGRHNEALQIQREIEAAMVSDFDVRARERLVSFQGKLTDDFNGIIDGLVFGTESVTDVLRNGLRNLINTTLSTMNETIVENMTGVKGGLGGLLGTTIGGLLSGFMGFGGGVPKRAAGGPVMAGMPYLVNEETPNSELYVPSRNGYILNRRDAMAAVGNASSRSGNTYNLSVSFHVNSSNGQITRESQHQAAQRLASVIRQAEGR